MLRDSVTFEFSLQALVDALTLRVPKTGVTGLLCYLTPFSVMIFALSIG